jgi:hypothetical protein
MGGLAFFFAHDALIALAIVDLVLARYSPKEI